MRVFLTGATGFVGANVARRLIERGDEVHALVRPASRRWRLDEIAGSITVHEGDLLTSPLDEMLSEIRPDAVFHLAAYGAYHYEADARRILETTIIGAERLFAASKAAEVRVVVSAGSSSEYGMKDHPMREDERIDPNTIYAIGKAAQTHLGQYASRSLSLPVITLRLFSVYGPYEEPGRLVPTVIKKAIAGVDIELAHPDIARDYIHVDDVAGAFLSAADHPELGGNIINVGTGIQSSLKDIHETVVSVTGSQSKPVWGAYEQRAFDTNVWVADPAKMKSLLNITAPLPLREGIAKTVEWFKLHAAAYV
jgi:nucleoside-diphosphate-sugar epimerase